MAVMALLVGETITDEIVSPQSLVNTSEELEESLPTYVPC